MDDLISRQAAIMHFVKAAKKYECGMFDLKEATHELWEVPSAEPEIVRCKDCKYRDENWRRVSVRWLPCMDVRTGSNWYCGSAERRTDE